MHTINDLPIASMQKRVSSFVLDDIIVAVLLFIIFYDQIIALVAAVPTVLTPEAIETFQYQMKVFNSENLLLILSFKVIYHTFLIWQNNGMTLGKYMMKIKTVDVDNAQNLSFVKALLRAVLRIVSELVLYVGFLVAFFLPLRQTFHDKLARSVVVDV